MLKILFCLFVVVHGLIHVMGFVKAFHFAALSQLTQPISKLQGMIWLAATILFLLTIPSLLLKKDWWWMIAVVAIVISQFVIVFAWQDAKFGTLANLIILIVVGFGYGQWRFSNWYKAEVKAGLHQTANIPAAILTETDLGHWIIKKRADGCFTAMPKPSIAIQPAT